MRSFIFISIPRCLQLGINTGILQALGTIIGKDVRSQVELARQELEALQEEDHMDRRSGLPGPPTPGLSGDSRTPTARGTWRWPSSGSWRGSSWSSGTDFSFIAQQKRMTIGERDFYFYLDLLFYNRSLRRLVAIELKLGSFDAAYKGQMELYMRWLDR